MPRLMIEVDETVWQRLREQASRLGCDTDALARRLIESSLQGETPTDSRTEALRRLLDEMIVWLQAETPSEPRPRLTPELVDRWHFLMDRVIQDLGVSPESVEADITAAFEEYRAECSS